MHHIELKASAKSSISHIHIGMGAIERIATLCDLSHYSHILVVTDKTVAPLLLAKLQKAIPGEISRVILPAGELAKNIDSMQEIWHAMQRNGFDRKSLTINLGGGVVTDMGGFAASTYMRGMDFIHIPTTLVSQVDASIGGKTMIDFAGIKNLIGTFAQPAAIIIDPTVLSTVPDRQIVAGFAEIIKHGLIRNPEYLQEVTAKAPLAYSPKELESIITGSCRIKAEVVEADSTESDLRQILNFGHTVAHAVEAWSLETARPLLHGEAVAIGAVVEADLSCQKGLISAADVELVKHYMEAAGLPVRIPKCDIDELMTLMQSDKKIRAGKIHWTLLASLGKGICNQMVDDRLLEQTLKKHMV